MSTDRPRTAACDLDPDGHCNTHGGRHIEPAAAEPPDELILKVIQESLSRGADQDSIDLFLFSLNESGLTIALERAAQPPRGSLPPGHWEIDSYGERHWIEDEAGGSLTATDRPTASEEPPDGH